MRTLHLLDTCTGIAGFTVAARMVGGIETICTAETESYCARLIDENLGLDNAGDVTLIGVSREVHPHKELVEQDLVPCEETGFTSLCIEDFAEGILPYPDIYTSGFPCQDVTPANTKGNKVGIDGDRSGLVNSNLSDLENLEPPYAIFENSSNLNNRGLDRILLRLDELGYIAEWETISAAHFGYPHYRKRCYIVAYKKDSAVAKSGVKVFDYVTTKADKKPNHFIPYPEENPEWVLKKAVIEQPRSIKLRTKRINALGNSIVPQIAAAILEAIVLAEKGDLKLPLDALNTPNLEISHERDSKGWFLGCETPPDKPNHNDQFELFSLPSRSYVSDIPQRGLINSGYLHTGEPNRQLNPTTTTYPNLYSTLVAKDGNNNFTSKSRTSRPGKLGGLIGDLQRLGANVGGLNTDFAELFMGYKVGHTLLNSNKQH